MPKTILILQGKDLIAVELNWKGVFYTRRSMVSASNVDQPGRRTWRPDGELDD